MTKKPIDAKPKRATKAKADVTPAASPTPTPAEPVAVTAPKVAAKASLAAAEATAAAAAATGRSTKPKAAPKPTRKAATPQPPEDATFEAELVANAAVAPSPYRIFQIYYEPWHLDLLDPAFEPFDNVGTPTELMEFDIFERLARSEEVKGAEYWGALSWRFTEKTGLTGADLLGVMKAHPDVDVFYCNPHVHNEALYHNMWVQGETSHPRFLEISKAFFEAAGLPTAEFDLIMPAQSYSAANYFVAKPVFWNAYLPFIRKVVTLAEQKLPAETRKLLHSKAADDRGLHGGSTYLPFIVERLFPLFMRAMGGKLKGHRITLPTKEQELNIHLKLLRDMKDVSIRTKSPWLAACWVNYRALYMSQHHGREWCQKYLRAVTPAQIKFG